MSKRRKYIIWGIIACASFMVGDWLWSAAGPNDSKEAVGLLLLGRTDEGLSEG